VREKLPASAVRGRRNTARKQARGCPSAPAVPDSVTIMELFRYKHLYRFAGIWLCSEDKDYHAN
jgi:hypothetical protein